MSPEGRPSKPLHLGSRCNLEGYAGLDYDVFGNATRAALAAMPEGRCPYPPGDTPGQGFLEHHPKARLDVSRAV